MTPLSLLPVGVVLAAALVATVSDVRQYRISNLLTLPLLVSGLLYHGLCNEGEGAFTRSVVGALFGFTFLFLFYLAGGMGGGDVKLMAGVGAWLGFPLVCYVFVATAVAGGVYALGLIIWYRRYREVWLNMQVIWHRVLAVGRHLGGEDRVEAEVRRPDRRQRLIPFAAMVVVGIVVGMWWAFR